MDSVTRESDCRLPGEFVGAVDLAAELTHQYRSDLVQGALEAYLEALGDRHEFKNALVVWYLDDDVTNDGLQLFLDRKDAVSV